MNKKNTLGHNIEELLEKAMFASRWFMAPVYVVLSISLAVIMIKVVQEFLHYVPLFISLSIKDLLLFVLHILDLALIGSIVAISGINLLEAFMNIENVDDRNIKWQIAIHLVFVISGVLLAMMDYIASKTKNKY